MKSLLSKFIILFIFIFPGLAISSTHTSDTDTLRIPIEKWKAVIALEGVSVGGFDSGRSSLHVVFDPSCPHCATLWNKKLGKKVFGHLPAKWIPVTYLNEYSLPKAAALIRSRKASDLALNFEAFNYSFYYGGVQEVIPSKSEASILANNTAVWRKIGGMTPLMVYRSKKFGGIRHYPGVPSSAALLQSIVDDVAPMGLVMYKPN